MSKRFKYTKKALIDYIWEHQLGTGNQNMNVYVNASGKFTHTWDSWEYRDNDHELVLSWSCYDDAPKSRNEVKNQVDFQLKNN